MSEMVKLKFKGAESARIIPDVGYFPRNEVKDCPKDIAEKIVTQDPEGWEIVKTKKKEE